MGSVLGFSGAVSVILTSSPIIAGGGGSGGGVGVSFTFTGGGSCAGLLTGDLLAIAVTGLLISILTGFSSPIITGGGVSIRTGGTIGFGVDGGVGVKVKVSAFIAAACWVEAVGATAAATVIVIGTIDEGTLVPETTVVT